MTPIEAILPHAARPFGVKARTLAALARAGFPVPAAHALSSEAAFRHYQRVLPPSLQPQQLFVMRAAPEHQLQEAAQHILQGELEDETLRCLEQVVEALGGLGGAGLAVRSSSTSHTSDSMVVPTLPAATLDIHTVRGLHDAIRRVWAAPFRPDVFASAGRRFREGGGAPGVVVQAIVPAEVSGTLFTNHPLTTSSGEMLLNAFEGPGGDRDDGDLSPDTYRISKTTGWIRDRVLCSQPRKAGTRQVLDEHMLGRVIELGLAVESLLGAPRRIGWAVADERLYVLDARALVQEGPQQRAAQRRRPKQVAREPVDTVWSNAFVGELVPDVTTPLTWSLLHAFGKHGLPAAFEALGCRSPLRARLLANYRGRAYVNLSEFLQLASRVPGLRTGVELRGADPGEQDRLVRSVREQGRLRAAAGLPRALGRFASQQLTLGAEVGRFESDFREEIERMEGVDVRVLPGAALDDVLSDAHRLLDGTAALTLRAHAGLLAAITPMQGVLAESLGQARAQCFWPALLSLGQPWEHAGLVREVARLAEVFELDERAGQLLVRGEVARPEDLPAGQARASLQGALERIGQWAAHGTEIENPRFSEDAGPILQALRLQLCSPVADPLARCAARAQARRSEVLEVLGELPFARRMWVQQLLVIAQHYVRLRQRMLRCLVKSQALVRQVAVDASRRLQIREPAVGDGAATILTLPELHEALRGELDTLAPLIAMRRAQLARERALPSPPDSFVGYPRPVQPGDGPVFEGQAAGPGRVEAPARVLRGIEDAALIEPGEVLVVATVDAGWAPLFTTAAALVTERGSPLSSACFAGRDLGLPMVTHARGVTRRITSGQRIVVDGHTGVVQLS